MLVKSANKLHFAKIALEKPLNWEAEKIGVLNSFSLVSLFISVVASHSLA